MGIIVGVTKITKRRVCFYIGLINNNWETCFFAAVLSLVGGCTGEMQIIDVAKGTESVFFVAR